MHYFFDNLSGWQLRNDGRDRNLVLLNRGENELTVPWGPETINFLCLLIILRISEQQDLEQKAIAEFNGETFLPELPESAKWSTLRSVATGDLANHLQTVVCPQLAHAPNRSPLKLLPRMLPAITLHTEAIKGIMDMFKRGPLAVDEPFAPEGPFIQLSRKLPIFPGFSNHRHGVGEYATPDRIADLMIDLASPKPGERIYNPCTGTGNLLVRTAERAIFPAMVQGGSIAAPTLSDSFFGVEIKPSLCLLALARLMLAGIKRPRLELGDVLERPNLEMGRNGGFDVILCNPPIGGVASPEQSARFPIRSRSVETLILQHILAHLRPGGRAVVLMPEAFLSRPGAEEMLRKRILNEFRLESVLSLTRGNIPGLGELGASILVIHRLDPLPSVAFVPAEVTNAITSDSENWAAKRWLAKDEQIGRLFDKLLSLIKAGKPEKESKMTWDPYRQTIVNHELVETLASRRWELVPRYTRPDQLEVLLDAIRRTDKLAAIMQLGNVGLIHSGMSYRRTDFVENWFAKSSAISDEVRLVRVRDLEKNTLVGDLKLSPSTTMARMTLEGIQRAASHCYLREGDVLITVKGTVGMIAVVGRGGPKMVAASGVDIIRLRDTALASYLPRLLTTDPYQDWFMYQSIGATVSQLRIADLEQLPVPVFRGGIPPDTIRHIASGQSLEGIIRLLESKEGFSASVRFLLEDDLVLALSESSVTGNQLRAPREILKELVGRLETVRSDGSVDEGIEPLIDWLAGFHDFAARLMDIFELPMGAERFSSLQSWKLHVESGRGDFRAARDELSRRAAHKTVDEAAILKVYSRSEALYNALIEMWKTDMNAHLSNLKLSASIAPAQVTLGIPTEVSIGITNEGLLPLRKMSFETHPFESKESWSLISPGMSHHWSVKVLGTEVGKQRLFVDWSGRKMNEAQASGQIELAFEVNSLRAASVTEGFGENPYIYRRLPEGKHEQMFYGRKTEIDQILDNLNRPSATTIMLVEGNRGIGKTWLIKHLIRRHLPATWVPTFIDFQDFEGESGSTARPGIPTRNIFIGMARELVAAARNALPNLELPKVGAVPPVNDLGFRTFLDGEIPKLIDAEQPWTTFKTLFQFVRSVVAPRRMLLVLEEFDRIQDGIDSKITSDQVPENLRNLFQHQGEVAGIFTGSRTIRRLRKDYWNMLFSIGDPITLHGLQPDEARLLIEQPVRGRLVYAEEAIRKIINVTACQPLLIQGICHRVFALCKRRKQASVTLELVDEVIDEKSTDNEHFETLWGYLHSDRRRCVLYLVDELVQKDLAVSFNVLRNLIEEKGLPYSRQLLEADLKFLTESDILAVEQRDHQSFYRLEVPMFALWLRKNKDFNQSLAAAKDEIL
jgi:type I restriction enzyme M protein